MIVPTVGSVVRVRTKYSQGPQMIPPRANFSEYQGKVLPPFKWLTSGQFCLSGDNDWPIRVISVDQIQDLNVITGDTKKISTETQIWEVTGSKGNKYVVTKNSYGKYSCTCPGATFRGACKHIKQFSSP